VGSVQPISSSVELGRFFDTLYGDQEGFVYAPTKEPEPTGERFEKYFFQWPVDKEALIEHCLLKAVDFEVYYGPSLFQRPSGKQEDFLGTYFVWCEFDGNAPDTIDGLPEPAIKIQSSTPGHQHWYWKLDRFEKDAQIVETISQRIAYHAGADLACWNVNRVLRPPATVHHDGGQRVSVLRWEVVPTSTGNFADLPEVPVKLLKSEDIGFVPQPLSVLMKYPFTPEETEFFQTSTIEVGHRSDALAKMGHYCIEKGMTNAEALSILLNCDSRWGKYSKRRDQRDRLLGIINYCRSRHPIDLVQADEQDSMWRVYDYDEFMATELKIDWAIEGLVHRKGFVILSGPPDVGKSQFAIRFGEKLAKGHDFLKWKIARPMKIVVVSMEMPHEELKFLLDTMSFEDHELLRENFKLVPIGSGVKLNEKRNQERLNRILDAHEPDGVIFDSLGMAINDDMSSDKIILETFDYIHSTVRGRYGAFAWFIHHNRKAQAGNSKPNKLDDLYGSRYISAATSTGIGLWPTGPNKPIEVDCLKLRFAKKFDRFLVNRTPRLDFALSTEKLQDPDRPLADFGQLGNSI
jgi:hypothetical protein